MWPSHWNTHIKNTDTQLYTYMYIHIRIYKVSYTHTHTHTHTYISDSTYMNNYKIIANVSGWNKTTMKITKREKWILSMKQEVSFKKIYEVVIS